MPELPEVETIRRNLQELVVGKTILAVSDSTHPRSLRQQPGGIAQLRIKSQGKRISEAARRGKYLWLPLEPNADSKDAPPRIALAFHLGMSGQLRVVNPDSSLLPQERLRFVLSQNSALVFCDQRTFGHVELRDLVSTTDDLPAGEGTRWKLLPDGFEHIARDALDPYRDSQILHTRFSSSRRAVKTKLLDQSIMSGVGNIYADESLFIAGIHPAKPSNSLSYTDVDKLESAVVSVTQRALKFGGTSFDKLYVNSWGSPGEFAAELNVYGRGGSECKICATVLTKLVLDGRSTVFCPRCQEAASDSKER